MEVTLGFCTYPNIYNFYTANFYGANIYTKFHSQRNSSLFFINILWFQSIHPKFRMYEVKQFSKTTCKNQPSDGLISFAYNCVETGGHFKKLRKSMILTNFLLNCANHPNQKQRNTLKNDFPIVAIHFIQ